jgi:hypothetical protein
MGILDDAIREHLELKRKHGVAEDELQRQQEEALGPARRDVPQQHEDEAEPAPAAQDTALFDGEEPRADTPEADVADAPDAEAADAEGEIADAPTELHEPPAAGPTPVEPPPVEPPPADPHAAEHAELDEPSLSEEPPVAGQPPVGQEPDIGSHQPEPDAERALDADDARLGDTQPHGFDALDEDAVDEEELEAALEEDEPDEDEADDDELLASDPEHDEQDVLEDTPDFLQETPEHDRLWFEQKPPRDFDFD